MEIGFLILIIGGICQGSFGLGFKKYPPFSWAAFWGVFELLCVVTATLFAFVFAPRFVEIYSAYGFNSLLVSLVCGAVWGLSAVAFSKSIGKIGMSLVYGISMGISTISGSLLPMLTGESNFPSGSALILFVVGLALTVLGVIVVTRAGIKRDGGAKSSLSGVLLAVFSGLGSGFMNVGFNMLDGISEIIGIFGYSGMALSAMKWLPVLFSGCLSGAIYCACEVTAKKEWNTLSASGAPVRAAKLFALTFVWYAALILYGVAASLLRELGGTVGWILFNALALIVSVLWGLKTGEWKSCKKTELFIGCAILIVAWVFVALV